MDDDRAPERRSRDGMTSSLTTSLVVLAAAGIAVTVALWSIARARWDTSISPASLALLTGSAATLASALAAFLQNLSGRPTRDRIAAIAHRATHDELTGLPNRDELRQRLEAALIDGYRHDRVVGVLFIDLDGFKNVNDHMGHESGDELLKAFGTRLREVVRANDIVARLGGDEFVVVCQGATRESGIAEAAHNVHRAFEQPLTFGSKQMVVMPSIGVAVASRSKPATAVELVSHADQAMYRAKRDRAGVRIFDDAQRREVLDRREVERALVPALAEGQFRVHYQPIVSVSEVRVTGLEALLRWRHPVHGILGTERFLPVAEQAGMMSRLTEMVLQESTAQLSAWNELYAGADEMTVSINIAERQLADPRFPDRLGEILGWSGVPASRLALEIGEDLLLRRADEAAAVMRRLSELGVALVVDDFGTSRAALARARTLELVDLLKIDRSVVGAMTHDDVARAVVEASVSMARALQVELMAEGVETDEQRRMLEDLGIDRMQGYLFLRPLSASEFEEVGMESGGELARLAYPLRGATRSRPAG